MMIRIVYGCALMSRVVQAAMLDTAPVSIAAFLLVRNKHLLTQVCNLRKKKKYLIQKRSMATLPTQQNYKIAKKIYNFA